jgi:hypothetical protein
MRSADSSAAIHPPVFAGALFDRFGSYASTVWVAAGINVVGMVVAGRLPGRPLNKTLLRVDAR